MFNNLLFGVKRRILDEIRDAYNKHPAYSEKVDIYNKFPYEQRLQYGVVLRNASGSQTRMSADNYLGDYISHVRLARDSNYPGLSIEWVRENSNYITKYAMNEDVSSQLGPTQRQFTTLHPITKGRGETDYANNPGQIIVTVDGTEVIPEYVNGEHGIVMLQFAPAASSTVLVSYFYRVIDEPGIYVIDFIEDTQLLVAPIFIIDGEIVIGNTTGLEITANLDHGTVYPATDTIYLKSKNGGLPNILTRDTDYTIDYNTGEITFLNALPSGWVLYADYRYQNGISRGPYSFVPYQEIHEAIPGAIICIGRRAKKDDRQVVILSKHREPQARIYGGHWQMSLNLGVIAKDPIQMEEMTDHLVNELWGIRKNTLEFEGITLNSVEPTGETEETYIDTTGDLYYESSVDINVMTEWQEFIPYLITIKHLLVSPRVRVASDAVVYQLSNGALVESSIQPDDRHVIKYSSIGYERVS